MLRRTIQVVLVILALLALLIGCGEHKTCKNYGAINKEFDLSNTGHGIVCKVDFLPRIEIDQYCGPSADACTFSAEVGQCAILMPDTAFSGGFFDDIYDTWLLGHEFMHCIWGNWH